MINVITGNFKRNEERANFIRESLNSLENQRSKVVKMHLSEIANTYETDLMTYSKNKDIRIVTDIEYHVTIILEDKEEI